MNTITKRLPVQLSARERPRYFLRHAASWFAFRRVKFSVLVTASKAAVPPRGIPATMPIANIGPFQRFRYVLSDISSDLVSGPLR
jgi:hypothetical protein